MLQVFRRLNRCRVYLKDQIGSFCHHFLWINIRPNDLKLYYTLKIFLLPFLEEQILIDCEFYPISINYVNWI